VDGYKSLGGVRIEEKSFVAALLRMTAKGGGVADTELLRAAGVREFLGVQIEKAAAEPPHSKGSRCNADCRRRISA
jgi:hypothetical protein